MTCEQLKVSFCQGGRQQPVSARRDVRKAKLPRCLAQTALQIVPTLGWEMQSHSLGDEFAQQRALILRHNPRPRSQEPPPPASLRPGNAPRPARETLPDRESAPNHPQV